MQIVSNSASPAAPALRINNATIVNDGREFVGDVLVAGGRIAAVAEAGGLPADAPRAEREIDASGLLLLPGLIDDQVHFREPGLTHKADIASEARAAVAGGVTSFMEMPNTKPPATDAAALERKFARAAEVSPANYSFYLGATNDNIAEVERADPRRICGIKVFMGSSTGNMLVDEPAALEKIFARAPMLVAAHCEDTPLIETALREARERFGDAVPPAEHARIRSAAACLKSSTLAVSLARKHNARLHVLHISTAAECDLFAPYPETQETAPSRFQVSDKGVDEAVNQKLLRRKLDALGHQHLPHEAGELSSIKGDALAKSCQRTTPGSSSERIAALIAKVNPATFYERDKRITAEACVHHLWFCDADYARLGNQIKCNPAIKTAGDRDAVRAAVRDGRIDVIATDHAPHTRAEKAAASYFDAPSGLPLVQHSLQMLLDLWRDGVFDLATIVRKTSHAVADLFAIRERGYIREGYHADLVLVDPRAPQTVAAGSNVFYKCGWSPLEGHTFGASVVATLVNGTVVFERGVFNAAAPRGMRLEFAR
ncbi:MAG: amidohydrolase family protein [Puniceicoccales bacterium]|nr:amidohydrolase family protein [Puniceicoccales bacterium]